MECICNNSNTSHVSSEYITNTCGEPVYNVLPCDTVCTCPPHCVSNRPVVYTDQVYDKALDKWQSEINKEGGHGSGSGNGSGENALQVQLFTDVGNILVNSTMCTITAEVWDGRHKIENITPFYFSWKRISSTSNRDDTQWNKEHIHWGDTLIVPIEEIQKQTLYQCEFDFEEYFKNN